jgi:epoxide hydrolase-like predicted phosphatase
MTKSSDIKAVIFDCFGVLTADKWHEFRLSLPAEQQADASDLNQQYCRGMITKDAFLSSVAELTGRDASFTRELIDNEDTKNHQLLDYIRELKPHYKIGLLSNVATPWITDTFLTSDEQALFDAFVFSYEARLTKPDPRIYQLMADRLAVQPEQCIFIDDIARYCQAARDIGMQAITYRNFIQLRQELDNVLDKKET